MKSNSLLVIVFIAAAGQASAQSPYAGEEQQSIKSLSPADVRALRAGKGMGFAKLAELNGFPGPRHVLELSEELALDDAQLAETETLFEAMREKAVALGEAIIDAERRLDREFARGEITPEILRSRLLEIGRLQAELRYVHLQAHLSQQRLLSAEQIADYNRLRGYRDAARKHEGHSTHGNR